METINSKKAPIKNNQNSVFEINSKFCNDQSNKIFNSFGNDEENGTVPLRLYLNIVWEDELNNLDYLTDPLFLNSTEFYIDL